MPEDWKFQRQRFILCEGDHDKYFLKSLIKQRKLGTFQIMTSKDCGGAGGTNAFGLVIEGFPGIKGFKRLKGIAIVTDNDKPRTLPNMEKKLESYGYVPSGVKRIGTIAKIPVIILPLPDESNCGDLEKLCLPALYSEWSKAEECVRAYLHCTGAFQWKKQQQLNKAHVRCVISGNYETDPYKGLGYLFTERKMKHLVNHECFNELANALKRFDAIIKNGKFDF